VQRTAIKHKMKKVFGFIKKSIEYGSYAVAIINILKFANDELERVKSKKGQYSDNLKESQKANLITGEN